jgi:hypothetical protein
MNSYVSAAVPFDLKPIDENLLNISGEVWHDQTTNTKNPDQPVVQKMIAGILKACYAS